MRSPNCYIIEMLGLHEQELKSSIPNLVMPQKTRHEADKGNVEGYNPNKFLRTYGRILETPLCLTDDMLYPKPEGFPVPRRGISGEDVLKLLKMGTTEHKYYPSHHQPEMVSRKDVYTSLLKIGDVLHFYYKASPFILPKNIVEKSYTGNQDSFGQEEQRYVVKVDVIHSVCSSNNSVINDVACGVTVASVVMQEEEEIRTSAGIFTQSTVQPKYLTAKTEHSKLAASGSTILYHPKGNFEMDILGDKYYVIKDQDVLCELHGN